MCGPLLIKSCYNKQPSIYIYRERERERPPESDFEEVRVRDKKIM